MAIEELADGHMVSDAMSVGGMEICRVAMSMAKLRVPDAINMYMFEIMIPSADKMRDDIDVFSNAKWLGDKVMTRASLSARIDVKN